MSQRRRWLNGSFFAAVHSTVHFHYLYPSSHSFVRKAWIHVEMFYQLFNLIFSWFALAKAKYYIAFSILSESLEDTEFELHGIATVNVILNYAYLDVSWGTKGDNTVAKPLGTVATGKTGSGSEAEVPTDEKDIDGLYEDAIHELNTKPPKVESKPDAGTIQEDYYRTFRTNVLLAWVLTNSLLAAAITSTNAKASTSGANKSVDGYMGFLLASVAGLAFIRFVGSTMYMIVRLFAGE